MLCSGEESNSLTDKFIVKARSSQFCGLGLPKHDCALCARD